MNNIEFSIKPCTARRLPEILQLQEAAFAALPDPQLLRRNTAEMLGTCLDKPHLTLGAFDSQQNLAGIAILYDAQADEAEDLGRLLMTLDTKALRCANFKLCIVHPDYRGHRLMEQMGNMLEKQALKRGIEVLCSTVSPGNPASSHSLLQIGYHFDHRLEKYGFERELYYKVLNK